MRFRPARRVARRAARRVARRAATSAIGAVLLTLGLGCAVPPPRTADPRRVANAEDVLDSLAGRLADAPLADRPAGFALLTTAGELLFVDERGDTAHRAPRTASQLADCGPAICVTTPDAVTFLGWPDGGVRGTFARAPGAELLGGALEGERAVWVESEGPRRGRVVLAHAHATSSAVLQRLPADGDLGAPLLRGGVVLLPHDGHELLLLDADSGRELARRRASDDTIRWARVDAGQVFFGGDRVYALRPGVASQRRADAVLDPDTALVPAPPFHARIEADAPSPAVAAASDAARPAPVHFTRVPLAPSATPHDDRAYVVTRGHVFAFDGEGALRFVHALRAAPVATLATPDGLTLLDADGQLRALHPDDGSVRYERRLPQVRAAVALRALGEPERSVPRLDPPASAQSLVSVMRARDARFVGDQVYAAHLLVDAPESIAAALLDAYVDPRTEPPVRDAIAMTLRARRNDTDPLVRALGQRYDFLAEGGPRPPPPLEVILPALARADRHDAFDALLPHLDDPATPVTVLPDVITQLVRWGGPTALPPLLAFVQRYRADGVFRDEPRALVVAALAIDALGEAPMRERLDGWLARAETLSALRTAVAEARAERSSPRTVAGASGSQPPDVETGPSSEGASGPATRIARAEDVQAHALAQMERLTPCLAAAREADPRLRTVRVRMVLERGGRVGLVSVLPGGALERCLADVLVTLDWPRIRVMRQQVGITLHLAPEREPLPSSGSLWWQRAASRVSPGASVQPGLPWWEHSSGGATPSPSDSDSWWRSAAEEEPAARDRWWLPSDDVR